MHQQPLPILSCYSKFYVSTSSSVILFQALAMFCGHMFSQSFLDLDQSPLSQHTVFIPELLMVCSEQEICICINEQNNSWSHRSVASRPIEWQRETQGHIPFMCMLAIQRACTEDSVSAAMSGCSPWLNHTSSKDGASSHWSVAARPIEQQRETQGRSPFLRARSRYATCMSAGQRISCDARMLAPAKPHNVLGWDLVSRVDCIAKLRIIEWQREKQGRTLFLRACYSIGAVFPHKTGGTTSTDFSAQISRWISFDQAACFNSKRCLFTYLSKPRKDHCSKNPSSLAEKTSFHEIDFRLKTALFRGTSPNTPKFSDGSGGGGPGPGLTFD